MLLAEVIWFVHRNLNLIFTNVASGIIHIHRLINELLLLVRIKSTDELPLMSGLISHKFTYQTTSLLSDLRWSVQLALIRKFLTVNLLDNVHCLILREVWLMLSIVVSYLINLAVRVRHHYRRRRGRDVCILNFFDLFSIWMRLLRPCFILKQWCLPSLQLNWLLWLVQSQAVWVRSLLVSSISYHGLLLWLVGNLHPISLPILSCKQLQLIRLLLNNTKPLLIQLHQLVVLSRGNHLGVFGRRRVSINACLHGLFGRCVRSLATTCCSCILSVQASTYLEVT